MSDQQRKFVFQLTFSFFASQLIFGAKETLFAMAGDDPPTKTATDEYSRERELGEDWEYLREDDSEFIEELRENCGALEYETKLALTSSSKATGGVHVGIVATPLMPEDEKGGTDLDLDQCQPLRFHMTTAKKTKQQVKLIDKRKTNSDDLDAAPPAGNLPV